MSNYAKKCRLKNEKNVDIKEFTKKSDLVNLKSDVDKLVIGKLESTPADLCKIINVMENDVVKMTAYDELVKLVNAVQIADTCNLVK